MNIAELFVRIRGDTSDLDRAAGRTAGALRLVEGGAKGATLQTGRLGNQFANLAGRIAGLHPVVGNLAGVLGNFTLGAGLTVGILAGVAAVAVAYDKLTEASRKAMAAGDKLAESYNKVARISALGIGGQQLSDIQEINKGLEEHHKWLGFIIAARVQLGSLGGLLSGIQGKHSKAITTGETGAAAAEQQRVNAIGMQVAKNNQAWADRILKEGEPAREAARKAAAAALQASEKYWHGQSELWKRASDMVAQLNEEARQFLLDNPVSGIINAAIQGNMAPADMPSIDINAGLTKEQQKTREKMGIFIDDANGNAKDTQAAIWGAALQSANIVAGALNIGGGGRGSGIGGALGSAVGGAALGGKLGSFGGPVGAVVGAIAGSFIGGLFDKDMSQEEIWAKQLREQKAHTAWLKANNGLLGEIAGALLNTPSGYKINRARYDATDVSKMGEAARRYTARGGANPLLVGT